MDNNTNLDIHAIEKNRYFHCEGSKITWSAVLSGSLIAFGLTLLFNLLTVGIGLVMYKTTDQGVGNLALEGYLVTLFGAFVILFIAGWKTGKLIKIFPLYTCNVFQEKYVTNNPNTNIPSSVVTTDTITKNKCHICVHGMTHGFLAWIIYLIISLLFIVFFAQSTSLSYLKSSYLTLPEGYTQSVRNENSHNQYMNVSKATQKENTEQPNQNRSAQASTTEVRNAGKSTIAIFLVLVFGALGASLGSYLGAHANKKCLMKKMYQI